MSQQEKKNSGFMGFFKEIFFHSEKPPPSSIQKNSPTYNESKQKQVEALCHSLFQKKSLITSGRLQLIGLAKVKQRMGKKWIGFQPLIYEIVEGTISKHIVQGDIFVRYQDDKYVVVFGEASLAEGELKAQLIAEEIKNNIFSLNKEELKDIDIERDVAEVATASLRGKPLNETIAILASSKPVPSSPPPPKPAAISSVQPPVDIKPIEVGVSVGVTEKPEKAPVKKLNCSYMPLWDVHKGALTTYLCCAPPSLARSIRVGSDAYALAVLEAVISELKRMRIEDQKFFIVCPVHHGTLYHESSLKKYADLCQKLTMEERKFLILMMTEPLENLPKKTAYWFVSRLKTYCSAVFAEVPAKQKTDFFYYFQNGFDALGIDLKKIEANETVKIEMMNAFSLQARNATISGTFLLGISTLSLATSATCAGFRYLGGAAIHEDVPQPDKIYRYKHEDLLSALGPVISVEDDGTPAMGVTKS